MLWQSAPDTVTRMSQPPKTPLLIELFPEETREAAELLKQAVPLMVRHDIPPNPVHYALWYTYSKGLEPDLNRRLDKIVKDFDSFPRNPRSSSTATTSSVASWTPPAPGNSRSSNWWMTSNPG